MPRYRSLDQVLVVERLVGGVAPELGAHPLVQALGERLGQPVGQRLEQDRVVVVVRGLELATSSEPDARGDGEAADVVGRPVSLRRDEVGERPVGHAVAVLALLAQVVQRGQHLARVVGVDLDVVADRVGREEAVDAARGQPLLVDHPVEHLLRVVVELARGLARGRGLLRMSGNLPFISQALKNGCQSM